MKKKIPILVILATLIIASITTNSTSASSISDIGEYWTIPEMIALEAEINQEREARCGNDYLCEESFDRELLSRGGKYKAVDTFSRMVLLITSINVNNSTMRVLFHDHNPTHRRSAHRAGKEEQAGVADEVFVAWFEEEPRMFNNNYARERNYDIENYYLFHGSATENGYGWLLPNQEIEFEIEYAEVMERAPHYVFFTMIGENTNVSGLHDYSSCFASPDYQAGMECRMVFTARKGFTFLPTLPGKEPGQTDPSIDHEPSNTDENESPVSGDEIPSTTDNESSASDDELPSITGDESSLSGDELSNVLENDSSNIDNEIPAINQSVSSEEQMETGNDTNSGDNQSLSFITTNRTDSKEYTKSVTQLATNVNSDKVVDPTDINDYKANTTSANDAYATINAKHSTANDSPLSVPFSASIIKRGQSEEEFPWYLILIIFLTSILLFWLFFPAKRRKKDDEST